MIDDTKLLPFYEPLGRLTIAFSQLEHALWDILAITLDENIIAAEIIGSQLGFGKLLNVCRGAASVANRRR